MSDDRHTPKQSAPTPRTATPHMPGGRLGDRPEALFVAVEDFEADGWARIYEARPDKPGCLLNLGGHSFIRARWRKDPDAKPARSAHVRYLREEHETVKVLLLKARHRAEDAVLTRREDDCFYLYSAALEREAENREAGARRAEGEATENATSRTTPGGAP